MSSPPRDTVFVSYSHRDRVWHERILTFLKPFTREGTLSVWSDTFNEVGGLWRRELEDGLRRAAVGLILVTPDYLASDFIMNEELAELCRAARANLLRIVWVPVSASHWKQSPLEAYQAAYDPREPLDSLPEAQRNAALVRITETVVEAMRLAGADFPAAPRKERRPTGGRKAARPRGALECGDLHNVPELPLHHVPRSDDLDRLRGALLEGGTGAMGITGEAHRMGLHGLGGIGKSVLAAALARDQAVRSAFPGGVYWVLVGDAPDVPRLQAQLLARAGGGAVAVADAQEGRRLLAERFAGRAVLLVLDDVWEYRHARPFDVLGLESRLLLTTRDTTVLTALGAHSETVRRLPEDAALALLAGWSGWSVDELPEAARVVARECGCLPLALAVAGARIRDGVPWEVVRRALAEGRLEFLDHPYGNVFASLRVGVEALSPAMRERYLELAVFPEDEPVPAGVVLALWRRTAGLDELAGYDLLARLRSRALLESSGSGPHASVELHDLQHDFVRISVPDLRGLHAALLDALAAGLLDGSGEPAWWRLPSEPRYAWVHLGGHLVEAGRGGALVRLLYEARWLAAKIRAAGLPALLRDFERVPRDEDLALVAGALRLSSHALARDPGQLLAQLTGRLLGFDRPAIRALLSNAAASAPGPWLRPLIPSLTPPSGALVRTLSDPSEWLMCVVVTPDGRFAVSSADTGLIKAWDLAAGAELRPVGRHPGGGVRALALTPDGLRAVSGSQYGSLKVWDVESGLEERTLGNHASAVHALAVTPDGTRALSSSEDRTVKLWDLENGVLRATLGECDGPVRALAITPDGRNAVSGDDTGVLRIWDLEREAELARLSGHTDAVRAVVVTPDGRHLASGDHSGEVKIWDLPGRVELRSFSGRPPVTALAACADGRRIVAAYHDGLLKVWDLAAGTVLRTLPGHAQWVNAVATTPDGRHAVSASYATLMVWDLEGGSDLPLQPPHARGVVAVAVTPDGCRAVSAAYDRLLKVWDADSGAWLHTLNGQGTVSALELTTDGRRAVTASTDRTLRLWEVESGREIRSIALGGLPGGSMALSPDGRVVLLPEEDGILRAWELESGTQPYALEDPGGHVSVIAAAPVGMRAVSGAKNGTVALWDLRTGRMLRVPIAHQGAVNDVGFTADGNLALTASDDRTVNVWDVRTGTRIRTLVGHADRVTGIAVSEDGSWAVTASEDETIRVWSLQSGRELRSLGGHPSAVHALAITADGQWVVSASRDGALRLQDLHSGSYVAGFTLDAQTFVRCVVDGRARRIVMGDQLGHVHVLSVERLEVRGLSPEPRES